MPTRTNLPTTDPFQPEPVLRQHPQQSAHPTKHPTSASCLPRSLGFWRRYDFQRASERGEHLKRLADLCGLLAGFEINDEPQADACRARELVLPQAEGLAGSSYNIANLGGGKGASVHDLYRTGKYHEFPENVYQNFPLGK